MRIGGMAFAAAVCVSTLSAEASTRPPRKPATGWRELTSDHFQLQTDLPSKEAAALLAQLERARAWSASAVPQPPRTSPLLGVVAFANKEELHVHLAHGENVFDTYVVDATGRDRLLLDGGERLRQGPAIASAVTQYFTALALPRGPRWLLEGLAYQAWLAHPVEGEAFPRIEKPLPVKEIFDWPPAIDMDFELTQQRSITSSFLVEMLSQEHAPQLAALERRLGQAEKPVQAWNAIFPDWTQGDTAALARLDQALLAHWSGRKQRPAPEKVRLPRFTEREMDRPAVCTLELELPRTWPTDVERSVVAAALASDPGHVAALITQARVTPRSGLSLARRAVAKHPEDPQAWRFLAWNLSGQENTREREEAIRKALALAPDRMVIALQLAVELLTQDRRDEALAAVNGAVALTPWSVNALSLQARALAANGMCDRALTAGRLVVELMDDNQTQEGRQFSRAELESLSHKCGSSDANRADTLSTQARQAYGRGDPEESAKLLEQASALDPLDRQVWNNLGLMYLRLDRPAEAVAAIKKQLEVVPDHPQAWNSLGLAQQRLGHVTEAEAAYRKQLELTDDHRGSLINLGKLLVLAGRPDEARVVADRLLTLESRDTNAAILLARAEIMSGYKDQGVQRLKELVSSIPGPVIFNASAYALTLCNVELELADKWAQLAVYSGSGELLQAANDDDALAKTQSLAAAWDTQGWARFRAGDSSGAERYIRAAEKLRASAEISDHLGQVLEKAGNRDEAARAYARALASPAPEFEINGRLSKLVGAAKVDQLVREAKLEVAAAHSFKVPAAGMQGPQGDVLLAFKPDGTVAEVRTSGSAALPLGTSALRGLSLKLDLPVEGGAVPLVRARYTCSDGTCTADFTGSRPGPTPSPTQKQ